MDAGRMLHGTGAMPRMALGNVALPYGTRSCQDVFFPIPAPPFLPDTCGPPGHSGRTSIPCQGREEWRGAVFTEAGSEQPWGVTPREPRRGKNVAVTSPEHDKGTLRHWEAAQPAAPLSRALGPLRTPWHRWAAFDRPWLV